MIDAISKKPLEVEAYEKGLPILLLPESQLDQVRAALDAHQVRYWVDEGSMSVDDEPWTTFITFARGTNPAEVQRILDRIA